MIGFINLHRKLINWEWYTDSNTKNVFIHLLLLASFKTHKYRGIVIKTGQIMTGRDKLANELGISVQQVRTALKNLQLTNELTIKSSRQGTVIQMLNYEDYQQPTNKVTNEQPTSNQRATTINKGNKENNDKIYRSFKHLSISIDEVTKLKSKYSIDQIDDCIASIENYAKNKTYTSLYLTASSWLKKSNKNKLNTKKF